MKDKTIYIKHILDCIQKIEKYSSKITKNEFLKKSMIQDAIIRQIEIMGEASKLISEKTKKENLEIPWKDMTGMRDKLIHGYFGVDLDAVWQTVKKDIPTLKKGIKKIIKIINKNYQ